MLGITMESGGFRVGLIPYPKAEEKEIDGDSYAERRGLDGANIRKDDVPEEEK